MVQVRRGCATTTEAVRREIQNSQERATALAKRFGINQKTVAKWGRREMIVDLPTGPKGPKSTSLCLEEEAIIVAVRKRRQQPLDDGLYALQTAIPHLTRSSLHHCPRRQAICRLPDFEGSKPEKMKFKNCSIGLFPIDLAVVQNAEGKFYLNVAFDRTGKFAFVQWAKKDR